MSRVKIVKEAGAKPTDFENTVAKVLRLFRCRRARRTVGRQRSRRGDFVSEGNPTRALFLYAKNGAHARAKKKGEGARRHSKNAHGLGGFERRDACVARGTRSRGVSRVAMWSLDPERDFFFGPKECLCTGRRRRCVFMTPIEDKNRRRRHRFVSIRRRGFLMLTMYCSFSFSFNRPFKI